MNRLLSPRCDPRLIEETVFLALRNHPQAREFQKQRDWVYEIGNLEERERRFGELNRSWFIRLELGNVIEEALGEQPTISACVESCFVLCAMQAKEQGAELFVAPDEPSATFEPFESPSVSHCENIRGDFSPSLPLWKRGREGDFSIAGRSASARRTLRILLMPKSLLKPEALLRLMRHELLHIADMLDPAFAYEPTLPRTEGGPTYDTLITNRYRVLWDVTINGRMVRRGWILGSARDGQLNEFARAFPMLAERTEDTFNLFFNGDEHSHPELAAFAFDPRAAAGQAQGASAPGTHCPLCKFPTYIFEPEPNNLGSDVLQAINHDFPQWTPSLGLCKQCADLYRASRLSVAAARELPGWHPDLFPPASQVG